MNLSLSLDAKEVLFHLNYMGYRNVSREQLKSFCVGKIVVCLCFESLLIQIFADLKKLIKYESSPRESTEINIQAGPSSVNIQRLFEAHTITSKAKEKAAESSKTKDQQQKTQQRHLHIQHRVRPVILREIPEDKEINDENKTEHRPKSAGTTRTVATDRPRQTPVAVPARKSQKNPEKADKENIPEPPSKSKMWIRPKSGSEATKKLLKRNDPVALYQKYQKDWEKFKINICESSHSDLRWKIREQMMGNN